MSVEDIRGILDSSKVEETSGSGTNSPLRHFKGKLVDIKVEERTFNDGRTGRTLKFEYADIEIYESVEPYAFPTHTLELSTSPEVLSGSKPVNARSRLGHLVNSAKEAAGKDVDLADMIGTYLTMQFKEGLTKIWSPNSKERDGDDVQSWQVVAIEGVVKAAGQDLDPDEVVVELVSGQSQQQAMSTIATELPNKPVLEKIKDELLARTLFDRLVKDGKLTVDEQGFYRKPA